MSLEEFGFEARPRGLSQSPAPGAGAASDPEGEGLDGLLGPAPTGVPMEVPMGSGAGPLSPRLPPDHEAIMQGGVGANPIFGRDSMQEMASPRSN
jgi:hypothetical protein